MHLINNISYPSFDNPWRSVENHKAMNQTRNAPPALARSSSTSSSEADVSGPAPASTPQSSPAPAAPLEDILDDPEFDQISDHEHILEDYAVWRRDPAAVRRRAMAEDFREGHLETFVDSPQKELAGTQNQYVSYQVTTKVGARLQLHCKDEAMREGALTHSSSPTFNPSRSPTSPSAVASQTLSSSTNSSQENTHNVLCRRCPTSTRWNTYAAIGLVLTSCNGVHIRCTAS